MARLSLLHGAAILALVALPLAATPSSVHGSGRTVQEPPERAPALPVLVPAFRREAEARIGQLVPTDELTADDLDTFAQLTLRSRHLGDVARAAYLDWVARSFVHRRLPARAVDPAYRAYVLRKDALGYDHPLTQEALRAYRALGGGAESRTRADREPAASEPQVPALSPELRARVVLELGSSPRAVLRETARVVLGELRANAPVAAAAGPQRTGSIDDWLLLARLWTVAVEVDEAETLLRELAGEETEAPVDEHPATLALVDFLFQSGRLVEADVLLAELEPRASGLDRWRHLWRTGRSASSRGAHRVGQAAFDEAAARLSFELGPDHEELYGLRLAQARALAQEGDRDGAKSIVERVAAGVRTRARADARLSLETRRLTLVCEDLASDREAVTRLSDLYAECQERFGLDDPLTLRVGLDLGLAISLAASPPYPRARASELLSLVVAHRTALFGAEDLRTLRARHELANHRSRQGRPKLALTELAGTTRLLAQRLPKGHPDWLDCVRDWAFALQASGSSSAATEQLEEAARVARQALGNRHVLTHRALADLADQYRAVRDSASEKRVRAELYALKSEQLGEEHPDTRSAFAELSRAVRAAGD